MLIIVDAMVIEGIHFDILANLRDSIAMSIQRISKIVLSVSLLATASVTSAATWPSVTGQNIGTGLSSSFEPSGIIYSGYYNSLFVVHDEGQYVKMDTNGNIASGFPKTIGGDLEAITVTSSSSGNVYIGVENPDSILRVDALTGNVTGTYLLTGTMTSASNGLESLTYVPDAYVPSAYKPTTSGGLFYAGDQDSGNIYIFDVNRSTTSTVTHKGTILNPTSMGDLADLFFDSVSGNLFALYDGDNKIVEMTTGGVIVATRTVPGSDQEGLYFTYSGNSIIYYIAQDSGGVIKYSDVDNDAVATNTDCNDANSTVSSYLTVYQDYDNDGLGNSAVSQQVCSLTAPTGYVTNSSDTDDSGIVVVPPVDTAPTEPEPTPDPIETIPTEPIYSAIEYLNNDIDDDGDGSIDEWNTLSNNGVHPIYGTYNANSTTLYKQVVTSIAGATNGAIKVKFADGSGYRYNVLVKGNTSVTAQNGTAYLLVRAGKKYALVNAYTGEVLDSLRTTGSVKVHLKTLSLRRK